MKIQNRSIKPSAHISKLSFRMLLARFCPLVPKTLCPRRAQLCNADTPLYGLAKSLAPEASWRKRPRPRALKGEDLTGQIRDLRSRTCPDMWVSDLAGSLADFRSVVRVFGGWRRIFGACVPVGVRFCMNLPDYAMRTYPAPSSTTSAPKPMMMPQRGLVRFSWPAVSNMVIVPHVYRRS